MKQSQMGNKIVQSGRDRAFLLANSHDNVIAITTIGM